MHLQDTAAICINQDNSKEILCTACLIRIRFRIQSTSSSKAWFRYEFLTLEILVTLASPYPQSCTWLSWKADPHEDFFLNMSLRKHRANVTLLNCILQAPKVGVKMLCQVFWQQQQPSLRLHNCHLRLIREV